MNKYHNTPITIDNIKFQSKKEGNRYQELKLLERAGEISDLRLQVKYELQPSFKIDGKTIKAINYIADFVYEEKGKIIVEDVKGIFTNIYKLKAKMFAYKYGFKIKEV